MYTLSSSVIGSYSDITSRDFLVVQQDHALRRSWDAYILQLETVDREEASGSEVVHWVMKFPGRKKLILYNSVRNYNSAVIIFVSHEVTHTHVACMFVLL